MRHKGIVAVVASLLLTFTLSVAGGCTGTRAYIAHDYEFGPGEGTVVYRVGDGNHHHKYKKVKYKKVKYKKPKHKKPKKHDRHYRHHDHDD